MLVLRLKSLTILGISSTIAVALAYAISCGRATDGNQATGQSAQISIPLQLDLSDSDSRSGQSSYATSLPTGNAPRAVSSFTNPAANQNASFSAGQQAIAITPIKLVDSDIAAKPSIDTQVADAQGSPVEDDMDLLQEAMAEPAQTQHSLVVRSGDSLTKLFKRVGLSERDVYDVTQLLKKEKIKLTLHPGREMQLVVGEADQLLAFVYQMSFQDSLSVSYDEANQKYKAVIETIEPTVSYRKISGVIESSLARDGKRAGLSEILSLQLANLFAWDIDFALDVRKGDQFEVVVEEKHVGDHLVGSPKLVAARYVNEGKPYTAARFVRDNGSETYYDFEGHPLNKAFLRSPVDFRRISSTFKPERYHPVLGVKRPHKGVDYAASTGTPIKAAGDGKVQFIGTKGGYGKTIILKHRNGITTLYGHQSRFASGLRRGDSVSQGDIIGYVGKSGLATGPHLHYEFRINGVHKNPLTIELPSAEALKGNDLQVFLTQLDRYQVSSEPTAIGMR